MPTKHKFINYDPHIYYPKRKKTNSYKPKQYTLSKTLTIEESINYSVTKKIYMNQYYISAFAMRILP